MKVTLSAAKCLSKKPISKNAYGKQIIEIIFYDNSNIYIWNTTIDSIACTQLNINGVYDIAYEVQSQVSMDENFLMYISNVSIINTLSVP